MIKNKREALLLSLFVAATLVVVGMFSINWFSQYLAGKRKILANKEALLVQSRQWQTEEGLWLQRQAWLDGHPMPAYKGKEGEARFVQDLQASLTAYGITTVEQRIQETRIDPKIVEASVDFVLSSSLEQIVRWLHNTQKPGNYRVVTRMRIKSDEKDSQIRTEVSLIQLFRNGQGNP